MSYMHKFKNGREEKCAQMTFVETAVLFFARQETEAATIYHDPKVDETHREKKRGLTQKK